MSSFAYVDLSNTKKKVIGTLSLQNKIYILNYNFFKSNYFSKLTLFFYNHNVRLL